MSFFKYIPHTLLILSYYLISPVHFFSNLDAEERKTCEGQPSDYYLSLALRDQSRANQVNLYTDKSKALALHQDAIRKFEIYFRCVKPDEINVLTHLNRAHSYLELGEYQKSKEQIDLALVKDPNHRDANFFQSKILIRQGKLTDAEKLLESKISHYPEDSDYLFLLGSLNKELGQFNKSNLYFTSLYDSILKREGNQKYKIHVVKNLGENYYQLRELNKSVYYYQFYLQMNPKDMDAKLQVAQIFNVLGNFGASKKILQEIHILNPSNKEVELLLAEMHFVESRMTSYPYFLKLEEESKLPKDHLTNALFSVLKREWSYADIFFREFLPKHKSRLAARLAWIDVLRAKYSKEDLAHELKSVSEFAYSLRQFQLAQYLTSQLVTIQEETESLRPGLAYSYYFMSNCMEELGAPNRAILYEKKAIAIAGDSEEGIKYQLHLGHVLLGDKIKRPDEAMSIAENILKSSLSSDSAWYLKSYSHFHKSQYALSLNSIQKAIEIEPSNSGYYFFRAIVHEKLNNWDSMEEDLKKTIELNPANPVPYNYLGFLLADKNERIDEAIGLIQKAVDLEPDNAAYQDSLGWVFFRKGDFENALFHLHLAKQIMEDRGQEDAVVLDHLADVYSAKEEIVKARELWKKALQLTGDNDSRLKIQKKIQNSIVLKR